MPVAARSSVLAHEPLRVPLADLLSADSKGKWWLVGAAWAGNPLVDSNLAAQQTKTAGGGLTKKVLDPEDDLMTLARKQGMNTDIRRKVFMAVMGSSVCRAPALAFHSVMPCADRAFCSPLHLPPRTLRTRTRA